MLLLLLFPVAAAAGDSNGAPAFSRVATSGVGAATVASAAACAPAAPDFASLVLAVSAVGTASASVRRY